MSAADVIGAASICEVWEALGGGPLRFGRGNAFWRGGDGYNVALDDAKGAWYDFAKNEGGGILDLVQKVTNCNRRQALGWLADSRGLPLDDYRFTQSERDDWAQRRRRAERAADELALWRARLLADLRAHRNACWDSERTASAWAREHLNDPAMAKDWRWDAAWSHALDHQRGDALDQVVEQIEESSPSELRQMREKFHQGAYDNDEPRNRDY